MQFRLPFSLSLAALALAACESPKVMAPTRVGARFSRDPNAVHTLALNTGNDDSALKAWVQAINGDVTHDTVWGVIPKGSVTMRTAQIPWGLGGLPIQSSGSSTRQVDIGGYSRDSSIFYVDSGAHAPNGYGAFAFIVRDPHVHFHDLTITSHADSSVSLQGSALWGNNDEAIRFDGSIRGAEYAEVNSVRIRGFRLTGIDVNGMKGAFIHDNEIFCAPSNHSTHYAQSMGIWMRTLPPPPPPGITNGTIQSNTVWDCGAESIPIENVQYVQVRWNTISCLGGQSCSQGFRDTDSLWTIGIALYSNVCGDTNAVAHNRIDENTIYGNGSLTTGIAIQGTAPQFANGYGNYIDSNFVNNVLLLGITDQPSGGCGSGSIRNNVFSTNTVEHTQNTSGKPSPSWLPVFLPDTTHRTYDLWLQGVTDTVEFNMVCSTDRYTIANNPGVTTIYNGNTHITCP
jgi:hypothetical protein